MPRVAITGGPGAGKTTLLAELAALGHPVVAESARAVIVERKARGESPRPEPLAFAQAILARDLEQLERHPETGGWTFYDRGLIDALGMLHGCSPLPASEVERRLAAHPFHRTAFILPPWPEIYVNDAERDHPFEHAVRVHDELLRWYARCGFALCELPRLPAAERARYVLAELSATAASSRHR